MNIETENKTLPPYQYIILNDDLDLFKSFIALKGYSFRQRCLTFAFENHRLNFCKYLVEEKKVTPIITRSLMIEILDEDFHKERIEDVNFEDRLETYLYLRKIIHDEKIEIV